MCNKTLVKLVSKIKCNSYQKNDINYLYSNINIFSQRSFCMTNLKQFPLSSRKLWVLPKHTFSIENVGCNMLTVQYNNLAPRGLHPYCTKNERNVPKIMDFPEVIWPSVFKSVRNWILSNCIIMRYFDSEFNLPDFIAGSKQAVELVSGLISRGDVDRLSGLVTPDVITQVKQSVSSFSLKQRQEFAIKAEEIYFCFPYEVGVMFPNEDKNEGETQSRFVEITMCYHALLGLKELQEAGISPQLNMGILPEYQDRIFICNYRFIREFTKGVQDDWTVNAINHFKPAATLNL